MGRGRTTTGMIISSIWAMCSSHLSGTLQLPEKPQVAKEDLIQRYLNGEYKLIINLLRVLRDGQTSKRLADFAIDKCSHVQNLREAIYQTKIRYEKAEVHEKSEALVRSANYLIRYFYLIVFTDFLIEKFTVTKDDQKFSDWLLGRPEISTLLQDVFKDFNKEL